MNKKTKRLFRLALAISVLSFSFCGASIAELENKDLPDRTGFKYDPLIVHAAFKTELQFDTNVFLESEDENFDVLTLLNPSVGFELPLGDNHFSADYSFGSWIFGVNNSHSYFDHTARALAEINWTDYKITLSDFYRYFSDRAGSEDVNRVKRQNNFLEATIGAEFDQLGFEAGYTFGVENFISDNTLFSSALGDITYHDKDRFLNTFAGQLSYRFLPKLSFLFDSILGILTYDSPKSSDSWYTEILMGLLGELHEDFSTNLKGGFRYQSYDTSELTDSNDFIGVVASGGISYRHTRDDIINFNVERAIYESTFQNLNYYNVNYVGLDYRHYFNKKLLASAFGYYQINLYPSSATVGGVNDKRYDQFFGGGAEIRYDIRKWISVKARYDYKQRKSRFGTFNYIDNLVTLTGTIGF